MQNVLVLDPACRWISAELCLIRILFPKWYGSEPCLQNGSVPDLACKMAWWSTLLTKYAGSARTAWCGSCEMVWCQTLLAKCLGARPCFENRCCFGGRCLQNVLLPHLACKVAWLHALVVKLRVGASTCLQNCLVPDLACTVVC